MYVFMISFGVLLHEMCSKKSKQQTDHGVLNHAFVRLQLVNWKTPESKLYDLPVPLISSSVDESLQKRPSMDRSFGCSTK